MSGNRISALLIICALLFSAEIAAQTDNRIIWQEIRGAGGYLIEIKDSKNKTIVSVETGRTFYDISGLPSGKYRYRLTTINKLGRRGSSTAWITLSIERAVLPSLKSVSPREFVHSNGMRRGTVTGEKFLSDTELFLIKNGVRRKLDSVYKSPSEIEFAVEPSAGDLGPNDIAAVNRGGFESVLPGAVEVVAPDLPVIESLSEKKIYAARETAITAKGNNFKTGMRITLRNEKATIEAGEIRVISAGEITFTINPPKDSAGQYDLISANNQFAEGMMKSAVEIVSPETPVIFSSSPRNMKYTGNRFPLMVTGENLTDKTKFELRKGNIAVQPEEVLINQKAAYLFFHDKKITDGEYNLTCTNPGFEPFTYKSALTVISCSNGMLAMNGIHAGAGWGAAFPFGDWTKFAATGFLNFHLYGSYPVLRSFAEGLSIEGGLRYSSYSMNTAAAGSGAEMSAAAFSISAAWMFSPGIFPDGLNMLVRGGGGIVYTDLNINDNGEPLKLRSLDPSASAGLSLRYYFFCYYFAELTADYNRTFYIGHPLDEIRAGLRFGVSL